MLDPSLLGLITRGNLSFLFFKRFLNLFFSYFFLIITRNLGVKILLIINNFFDMSLFIAFMDDITPE